MSLPDVAKPFGAEDFFALARFQQRLDVGDLQLDAPPLDGSVNAADVTKFIDPFH